MFASAMASRTCSLSFSPSLFAERAFSGIISLLAARWIEVPSLIWTFSSFPLEEFELDALLPHFTFVRLLDLRPRAAIRGVLFFILSLRSFLMELDYKYCLLRIGSWI